MIKKIGICSPSWNGPGLYPYVFNYGLEKVQKIFQAEVVLSSHAVSTNEVSYQNRAADIHELFLNDEIDLVIASIGGNDSMHVIKYIDLDLIKNHPKWFMGFSDTTALLMHLHIFANVPAIHGPSIMSGFAEPSGINTDLVMTLTSLFKKTTNSLIQHNPKFYLNEDNNWDSEELFILSKPAHIDYEGWHISNHGSISGRIYGGSLETLLRMKKANMFNFSDDIWDSSVLFLETSEEKPELEEIISELMDYHNRGILKRLSGLLFGQFSYRTNIEKNRFFAAIDNLILNELGYKDLVLIQNMNIGHIRPQWLIKLGATVKIDTSNSVNSFELIL
jgi:muramoyltetrapeptide carboxypeptidase LdcA involved in peptidoglycan recycling